MNKIKIKRIYDQPLDDDGYRVLIDRLWPRGISKKDSKLDNWAKEIAPSTELRKWFNHEREHFKEFVQRYREELKGKESELNELRTIANSQTISLLYAAKDPNLNQAVVLRDVLLQND